MEYFFQRQFGDGCLVFGSDNGNFVHDLKTVRGVKNRILNGVYSVGEWVIYRCTYISSRRSYEEVGRVTKV